MTGSASPFRWGKSLGDLVSACGADSADALLDLTDAQLEQLISETASQNGENFAINTLHATNIVREAREKREERTADPIERFLTGIALERFYDGFVTGAHFSSSLSILR